MYLKKALFISFIGHFLILTPTVSFQVFSPTKNIKDIQVTYYKAKPPEIKSIKAAETKAILKEESIKNEQIESARAGLKKPVRPERHKKAVEKKGSLEVRPQEKKPRPNKNIITDSIPGTTLPNIPICLDYYNFIREQIRRSLERVYKPGDGEGEVAITFILDQTGSVVNLKIITDKSSNDPFLRRLAYISVQRASPFGPFPGGLALKQISFNLTIVFKKD